MLSKIEYNSTRVSSTEMFIRRRPLSICETTDAVIGFLDFEKRKSGPLAVTEEMEIFVRESIFGASIELGGFEGSGS